MIRINVDYYDDKNRKLFSKYPNVKDIDRVVCNSAEVEEAEFMTYMLFKEKMDKPHFRNYRELAQNATERIHEYDHYLNFSNTVRARFEPIYMHNRNDITEKVGIAGSLCVANRIHGLTEADWEKIPEKKEKTTDYYLASDSHNFIIVEAKGSTSENNLNKNDSVYSHKSTINLQKTAERERHGPQNGLYYGMITVIDNREDSIAQCWLVDPEPPEIYEEPLKYRLLSRLFFYWRNLRVITPHSHILSNLINRIQVLNYIPHKDLDSIPLLNRNGEPIEIHPNTFSRNSIIPEKKHCWACLSNFGQTTVFLGVSDTYISIND